MSPMQSKLMEARVAFTNCNPLIRGQTAHVVVPLLEAATELVTMLEAQALALARLQREVRGLIPSEDEAPELTLDELAPRRLVGAD